MTVGFCWSRSLLEGLTREAGGRQWLSFPDSYPASSAARCGEPAADQVHLAHGDTLDQQGKHVRCRRRDKEHVSCISRAPHKTWQICIYGHWDPELNPATLWIQLRTRHDIKTGFFSLVFSFFSRQSDSPGHCHTLICTLYLNVTAITVLLDQKGGWGMCAEKKPLSKFAEFW